MTAPATTDYGRSWLASTPDGATVLRRTVTECTVVALLGAHFSARADGERKRRYFDTLLVSDGDKPLFQAGARFWLVVERVCLAGGQVETVSALALRRPGADSAEAAFTRGAKAGVR